MSLEERRMSVKIEDWEPISDAAFDDDVGDIDGIEALPMDDGLQPNLEVGTIEANSEDSTCEPLKAQQPAPNTAGNEAVKRETAQEGAGSDCGDGGAGAAEEAGTPCSATTPGSPAHTTAKTRASRRRTCKYCGVCSANRKNQWQARILMHGKVTHLGYFDSEEEAARVYDVVSLSLHREKANTNFPVGDYTTGKYAQKASKLCGLSREELQRSLGVKPIRKTSRYNGVSKKRGKWVAKVMIDKKLVYHASFEDEKEAAHAYDAAVRRLKPNKAHAYVNFREPPPAKPPVVANCVPIQSMGSVQGTDQQRMMGMPSLTGPAPDMRNQWNSLQGRMPFHHMQATDPNMLGTVPGMMPHPQSMPAPTQTHMGMYGHRDAFDQGVPTSHGQGMPQAAMMKHNSMQTSSMCNQTFPNLVDSQQMWAPDNSSRDSNQWPWPAAHRVGGMHPAYSASLTHMARPAKDDAWSHGLLQMPQAPWEHNMKPIPFQNNPMDSLPRGEVLRNHVQHLIQPPAMGMLGPGDRQTSSGSTWTNPYNPGMQGEQDGLLPRNFQMSHQWA